MGDVVLSDDFLLGAFQQPHRFFVSFKEKFDQLLEVLLRALGDQSDRVEEKVIIFDLKRMQPGHWRPDGHVYALDQLEPLLQIKSSLLIDEIDLLVRQLFMLFDRLFASDFLGFDTVSD